jgi:iron(III) transport system permease protein
MWGWRSSRTIAVGAAGAAFVLFCVLPFVFMLVQWFNDWGRWPSSADLSLDARQRGLLSNTAVLGAGTALLSTVLGVPLGVALGRMSLPASGALRILLAAPALLPSYVVGLAWLSLGDSTWMRTLPAGAIVLTVVLYPLSMLMTEAALRSIEPRLEEAASLVASPGRVLWHVTLPLARPSILASALLIFVLAISDFGVPALLRVRVFTTEIFTAFAALYDFNRATALSLPLLGLSLLVAWIAVRLTGEQLIVTRRGSAGELQPFDRWRVLALLLIACAVLMGLVVPIASLSVTAWQVDSWGATLAGSGQAIVNSLMLAAVGATLACAFGVILGYLRGRTGATLGVAADVSYIVLFAVPATITGVALIGIWNRSGVAGTVYGTRGMFVLVYLARFLPLAALAMAAGLRRVPASQEEAAAVSGVGWFKTLTRIMLPQIKLTYAAVWVIVFVLGFGELGASILVTPPGESTLPIRIYTLIANAPPEQVAALALLQAVVIFVPLAVFGIGLSTRRAV